MARGGDRVGGDVLRIRNVALRSYDVQRVGW